tara:strand:- start:308 stop:706 length:399 start_codon:yes stop_codon:yes gene_type:complete
MKLELGLSQNNIGSLPDLNDFSYENIFNMYIDASASDIENPSHFAFNILKTIKMPPDIDPTAFTYVQITGKTAWTQLSFLEYGTIRLWWLICVTNGILNPVKLPEPGTIVKIIKPHHVKSIISAIKSQLKDL